MPDWGYPSGTTTGISSVDEALEAIDGRDESRLLSSLHTSLLPCARSPPQELRPPGCGDTQAEGDLVPGYLYHGCLEPHLLDAGYNREALIDLDRLNSYRLAAVGTTRFTGQVGEPVYVILFSDIPIDSPALGVRISSFFVDTQGLLGFGTCNPNSYREETSTANFVLPPK